MSRHKTLLVASKFLRSNARASVSFIALWALTACGGSSTPNPQASLSTSTVTTSSPQLIANGTDAATITVQLKTSNGQNLNTSAGRVAFSQDASLGTIGQTTDHKDGTYTATYTAGSTAGTANISAQLNDQNLVNTVTLTLAAPEPTNAAPTIESFTISPADATNTTPTTLSWSVNDVDGDDLTCTLDVDGDGTPDYTVESCQTTTSQVHTFTVTGSYTPTLTVTDATNDPVVGPALSISVGPTLFTTLAASFSNHSLAIDNTGNAWAWGSGANGRLGTGNTDTQSAPTKVDMPDGVTFTSIAAGVGHSLAIDTDGNAWAWGLNDHGQLGTGNTDNTNSPTAVDMPDDVTFTSIATGQTHSLALDANGGVWAWGEGLNGRLGNEDTVDQNVPTAVKMLTNIGFKAIAAGSNHSLALDVNGNAWAWGRNLDGRLGTSDASTTIDTPTAVTMPSDKTFNVIAAGTSHSLAIDTNGNAWAWGLNSSRQSGTSDASTTIDTPTAVAMPTNTTFTTIDGGDAHSIAIDTSGNAWAWGLGSNGRLGAGDTANQTSPTAVDMPGGITFTAITAGSGYALAVGQDGDAVGYAWSWGTNTSNQLGDGTTSIRLSPVAVLMP